ncbi:MAG: hypothetical protein MK066_15055, partial [Crocinitomicaceae bacterium]|nr:hypothetical protein [Crocinitomicaceae bacterium]
MYKIRLAVLFNLLFSITSFSQRLNDSWEFLGPDKKPLEDKRQSANGIGPVEFITANENKEGHLLAGSLNGGLFYTTDGGEQWYNSGSDDWDYSGCSWAVYYPDNEKVWFANSCLFNANGGPGSMGNQGGIYRTTNSGTNWELIADKSAFINSPYMTVFGMKFHPSDPKKIFVYTSEGLYYSTDCLADDIKWNRVPNVAAWVYDLEFKGSKAYISHMQHNKWSVLEARITELDKFEKVKFVSDLIDEKTSITCEIQDNDLLILVNYKRKGDELWKYAVDESQHSLILKNQRVIFGKGNTFAVSPHDSDEIMV